MIQATHSTRLTILPNPWQANDVVRMGKIQTNRSVNYWDGAGCSWNGADGHLDTTRPLGVLKGLGERYDDIDGKDVGLRKGHRRLVYLSMGTTFKTIPRTTRSLPSHII
jgi:hypothetical protein